MRNFFKKYGVLMAAGLLLAGAVYANVKLNKGENMPASTTEQMETPAAFSEPVGQSAGLDYFESFRAERDAVRATEIEYLDEVIAVSYNDAETLADAQAQKMALVRCV